MILEKPITIQCVRFIVFKNRLFINDQDQDYELNQGLQLGLWVKIRLWVISYWGNRNINFVAGIPYRVRIMDKDRKEMAQVEGRRKINAPINIQTSPFDGKLKQLFFFYYLSSQLERGRQPVFQCSWMFSSADFKCGLCIVSLMLC